MVGPCMAGGACMVGACMAGGHAVVGACMAGGMPPTTLRHAVNERAVRILLECILCFFRILIGTCPSGQVNKKFVREQNLLVTDEQL